MQACVDLRDRVRELFVSIEPEEWHLEPGSLDAVVFGTFGRGTKTYSAALLLADRGFGEQAGMLNRSLFEHAVVAWWMLLQEDQEGTMERVRRHHDHAKVLDRRRAELHPELELDQEADVSTFTDEYVAELDGMFLKHGERHWTGLSLHGLVEQVEDGWDEAAYAGLLWKFFRFVNTWNNSMLHHSAVGLVQGIEPMQADGGFVLKLAPSDDWVGAALFASFWSYAVLALAALRCGGVDRRGPLREFVDQRSGDFREFTAEELKGVGRNDPCPCGSGRKYKHCHGR